MRTLSITVGLVVGAVLATGQTPSKPVHSAPAKKAPSTSASPSPQKKAGGTQTVKLSAADGQWSGSSTATTGQPEATGKEATISSSLKGGRFAGEFRFPVQAYCKSGQQSGGFAVDGSAVMKILNQNTFSGSVTVPAGQFTSSQFSVYTNSSSPPVPNGATRAAGPAQRAAWRYFSGLGRVFSGAALSLRFTGFGLTGFRIGSGKLTGVSSSSPSNGPQATLFGSGIRLCFVGRIADSSAPRMDEGRRGAQPPFQRIENQRRFREAPAGRSPRPAAACFAGTGGGGPRCSMRLVARPIMEL
jgi:hypothetical protein